MPRFYVVDNKGFPAVVETVNSDEFAPRFMATVRFVEDLFTQRTLKESQFIDKVPYGFLTFVPTAKVIYASTVYGVENFGNDAMVWRIGFWAINGFCTLGEGALRNYVVRDRAARTSTMHDITIAQQNLLSKVEAA